MRTKDVITSYDFQVQRNDTILVMDPKIGRIDRWSRSQLPCILSNTLGDFLGSKSGSDRASAQKAVALILDDGNVFSKEEETETADDQALRRFENISDPEQRSAFYNKNRDKIHRAFEVRKDRNSERRTVSCL